MIRQSITYIQRSDERNKDGERICYRLHDEREKVESLPTFTELRERFGRCEGKVYRDRKDERPVHCGYVFAKRERWYDQSIGWDDPKQFYTAETWVTFETVAAPIPVDLSRR